MKPNNYRSVALFVLAAAAIPACGGDVPEPAGNPGLDQRGQLVQTEAPAPPTDDGSVPVEAGSDTPAPPAPPAPVLVVTDPVTDEVTAGPEIENKGLRMELNFESDAPGGFGWPNTAPATNLTPQKLKAIPYSMQPGQPPTGVEVIPGLAHTPKLFCRPLRA